MSYKKYLSIGLMLGITLLTGCNSGEEKHSNKNLENAPEAFIEQMTKITEFDKQTANIDFNVEINFKNTVSQLTNYMDEKDKADLDKLLSKGGVIDLSYRGKSTVDGNENYLNKDQLLKIINSDGKLNKEDTHKMSSETTGILRLDFFGKTIEQEINMIIVDNDIYISKDILEFVRKLVNEGADLTNEIRENTVSEADKKIVLTEIKDISEKMKNANYIKFSGTENFGQNFPLSNFSMTSILSSGIEDNKNGEENITKEQLDKIIELFKTTFINNKTVSVSDDNLIVLKLTTNKMIDEFIKTIQPKMTEIFDLKDNIQIKTEDFEDVKNRFGKSYLEVGVDCQENDYNSKFNLEVIYKDLSMLKINQITKGKKETNVSIEKPTKFIDSDDLIVNKTEDVTDNIPDTADNTIEMEEETFEDDEEDD